MVTRWKSVNSSSGFTCSAAPSQVSHHRTDVIPMARRHIRTISQMVLCFMPAQNMNLVQKLWQPIDAATLAVFRIGFGLIMAIDSLVLFSKSQTFFPAWEFHPVSPGWEAIDAAVRFPAEPVLIVSAVAATFVAVGCLTRWAAALFAITHGYLFLWDASQFNNHNYLIVLLALWLAVTKPDQIWSLAAAWRKAGTLPTIPWWHLGIFLFHIGLVYTYGAINKLNGDWLQGEPLTLWLAVESHRPVIGPWLVHPAAKYVFAYGGLIFDAIITPALCCRRSRPWAIACSMGFHYTNSWMFNIGPFPWLMMAANVLFLEPDTPRRWLAWMSGNVHTRQLSAASTLSTVVISPARLGVSRLIGLYVAIQLLTPLRCYLYEGNPEWTEEAKNYSWRMMLSHKDTFLGVIVADLATGQIWEVDVREHLSRRQMRGKGVWGHPRHMASYARFLRQQAIAKGFQDPYVKVDAVASLNGRPYQYLVDPDIDLSTAEMNWWNTPGWVVPLQPHQPIGDYSFLDDSVKYARVMEVIEQHRKEVLQTKAHSTSMTTALVR